MSKFKVGDKVLYDGEVHTVIQVSVDGLTWKDVGYLDKDYVVLDLDYDNAIHYTEIEPYKTPHERLVELEWRFEYENEYTTVYYGKDSFTTIKIYHKNSTIGVNFYFGLELAEILVDYLKELEK